MNGTVRVSIVPPASPMHRRDWPHLTKADLTRIDRALAGKPRRADLDVRTYFDPLADRNASNALPTPKAPAAPAVLTPKMAAAGWTLRDPLDACAYCGAFGAHGGHLNLSRRAMLGGDVLAVAA